MISRRAFLTQSAALAAGFAGVWWLRENVIWPEPRLRFAGPTATSGWLAFSSARPRIVIVDAAVNGRPVRALLDSGAQSSVIDRALAETLGVRPSAVAPVVAFGVSGKPQIGRSAAIEVDVGDLRLSGLRAAILDLAPIAAASRRPFDLILGQDMLGVLIADIDFPGGRVAFHGPERHTPPLEAFAVPARTGGRELLVPIAIESRPLEVVLDTGASGALALSAQSAEAAGLMDGRPVRWAPSITFGGLSRDQVITAESLTFAGVDYEDVRVHIYTPAEGARVPAGLLGVGVLERFRVILDLGGGRLHLAPGPPPVRSRRRRG